MIEHREESTVEVGSNRSFGFVFCTVFVLIGLYPLLTDGSIRLWALLIAAVFLVVALVAPNLFTLLNRLWFKFGLLLSKIVNPLVMLLIYIVAMVPIGLVLKLAGKDLLRRKLNGGEDSYWIIRNPPGPEPESLRDQF